MVNTATTALEQEAFRRVLFLLAREPVVVDFSALNCS
jgi:Ala-tRNA(Pro) deacylase